MIRYRHLKEKVVGCAVDKSKAASYLGLSYQLIVSIEAGSRRITRNTAEKIIADKDVGFHFDKGDLVCWVPPVEGSIDSNKAA